jgi:trehalose-6-phosphate hydrolase
VNPFFGSLEDVDLLVEKVHEKGLKLILDIAVNHTSTEASTAHPRVRNLPNAYATTARMVPNFPGEPANRRTQKGLVHLETGRD